MCSVFLMCWGQFEWLWTAEPPCLSTPLSAAGCWCEPASERRTPGWAPSSQSPASSNAAFAGRALLSGAEGRRASLAGRPHRWPPASPRSSERPAPHLESAWHALPLLFAFQPTKSGKEKPIYTKYLTNDLSEMSLYSWPGVGDHTCDLEINPNPLNWPQRASGCLPPSAGTWGWSTSMSHALSCTQTDTELEHMKIGNWIRGSRN